MDFVSVMCRCVQYSRTWTHREPTSDIVVLGRILVCIAMNKVKTFFHRLLRSYVHRTMSTKHQGALLSMRIEWNICVVYIR